MGDLSKATQLVFAELSVTQRPLLLATSLPQWTVKMMLMMVMTSPA